MSANTIVTVRVYSATGSEGSISAMTYKSALEFQREFERTHPGAYVTIE